MRPSYLFVGLLGILLLSSCDLTSSSEDPISPEIFDEGDSWTYKTVQSDRLLDSTVVNTTRDTVRVRVNDTDVQIGQRSGLVEVEIFPLGHPDSTRRIWYQQSADSLLQVGYTIYARNAQSNAIASRSRIRTGHDATELLGKREAPSHLLLPPFRPPTSSSKLETDTTILETPILQLQAPLKDGNSWIVSEEPSRIRRTVLGHTSTGTPAGRFETVEIQQTYPQSDAFEGSTFFFFSEDGLVRQEFRSDTLEIRDSEGRVLGEGISRYTQTLIDF